MGQVGVGVGKGVDALHKAQYALLRVGDLERGELDGGEEEALYLGGVVLVAVVVNQTGNGGVHGVVVQVHFVV